MSWCFPCPGTFGDSPDPWEGAVGLVQRWCEKAQPQVTQKPQTPVCVVAFPADRPQEHPMVEKSSAGKRLEALTAKPAARALICK